MLKRRKFLFLIIAFVLVSFIISYIFFGSFLDSASCGDSSPLESCSEMRPYYCNSFGELVSKASICGCENNMSLKGDRCISEKYTNPDSKSFSYFLDGGKGKINFVMYEGVVEHLDSLPKGVVLFENESFSRGDYKKQKIDQDLQIEALKPLVARIENLEKDRDLQAKIAISLVQQLSYVDPPEVPVFGGRFFSQVSRYPYVVLYENAGWCEGKSDLLVLLLREMGFSTAFFYFPDNNHEAVGVACPLEHSFRETGYCFVETTSPSMISYSDGPYDDFFELSEDVEFIEFSEGISLSGNLEDYKDAKTFSRINNKLSEIGAMSNHDKFLYENILEKYGM